MTVREFLITLEEELKYLPKNKRKTVINIYQSKINNEIDLGTQEEKIIAGFEDPKKIAEGIYESEGINYLERRKRKHHSDDIFKMLVSSFAFLFAVSTLILLTFLFVRSSINYFDLLTLVDKNEIIWMAFLIISYLGTLLFLYIYLLDIFILIINFLFDRILKPFKKENKLKDFSIVDFIEEKIKVKKLFSKVLLGFVVVFIVSIICNFTMDTYLKRSYLQKDPERFTQTYDLNEFQEFNSIKFNIDEAKLYIRYGESLNIKLRSEFDKNLDISDNGNKLDITIDNIHKYDIFNFLKEPMPIMEVTLPHDLNISIYINNGIVDIQDLNINTIYLKMYQGNSYFVKTNIHEGNFNTSNCGLGIQDSIIQDLNLESNSGQIVFENNSIDTVKINNLSSEIIVSKLNAQSINLISSQGNIQFKEINCNSIDFNTTKGQVEVNTINSLNKIRLVSSSTADITLANAKTINTEVISVYGDIVFFNVESDANVETTKTVIMNKVKGAYTINCLGNFLTIQEAEFTAAKIQTKQTEASIKFVKADSFEYVGMNSKSTLYFIFAKNLIADDPAGDVLIDNYKNILTNMKDLELYDQYFQKVETFTIPTYIAYRDSDGIQY